MSAPARQAAVAGVALVTALCLNAPVYPQPPGSVPPVYAQRLRIPVLGDDFAQPRAVVADLHTGEVFVCDSLSNRIVIFDDEGRLRYQIPGGSAFQSPIDLAVDPEGFLFVLSQVSPEITRLDFDGRLIDRMTLSRLPEGVAGPRFNSLAISPAGDRLYLMDVENNRLWISDRQGAVQHSIDFTVGRPPKEIEELRYGHVDVYADTLLVPVPTDGLVHLFDLDGGTRGTIGSPGSAECQTMFPAAAALDDEGRVIILDQQRAMFMTWDLARGACLTEHYGFGNAPGALYQPSDLALDQQGRVYVSQGFEGRIQVYEGGEPAAVQIAARALPPEDVTAAASATEGAGALADVERIVRAWAKAWSGQQTEEYLAFYSDAFDTGRDFSRAEWETLRRTRLDRPRSIQVSLASLEARLTAEDRAEVAFAQTYRSDFFADRVDKLLILRREGSEWKILAERVVRTYRQ